MVLVPVLGKRTGISEQERFPASIAIIAPICVVSLLLSAKWQLRFGQVLPYLIGSALGGIAAAIQPVKIAGCIFFILTEPCLR